MKPLSEVASLVFWSFRSQSKQFESDIPESFQSGIPECQAFQNHPFLFLLFNFSYAMLMSKVVAKTNAGKLSIP